ncbi:hypothetical protein CTM89_18215 [Photobacterium leiognathi]|uniref:Uncharacterized protein n=1 Tax=Photobacterium leiognathi TaxID=553611 RepID=A0A2T3M5V1_PHOLE|nr:hypothetical protein CTM89_18215 [Photobacterium leiognathi]
MSTLFKLAAVAVVLRWGLMAVLKNLSGFIFWQKLKGITFSGKSLSAVCYVLEKRKNKLVITSIFLYLI